MEKSWKDWLYFSKKERNAAIVLLAIIVLCILVPLGFRLWGNKSTVDGNLSQLNGIPAKQSEVQPVSGTDHTIDLFYFDPNTLDLEGWQRLGLNEKTANTILHYRNKGGEFRKPEDLLKIYGMPQKMAHTLMPYVRFKKITGNNRSPQYAKSFATKSYHTLDVNTATENDWAGMPGIGEVLSIRIVHYRNARKGFRSVDDIQKVFGLSPETFEKIKPYLTLSILPTIATASQPEKYVPQKNSANPAKININTALEADFAAQRAIPKNVAKAIIIHREQHGLYKDITDIKKIVFINDEMYQRVAPYLKVAE